MDRPRGTITTLQTIQPEISKDDTVIKKAQEGVEMAVTKLHYLKEEMLKLKVPSSRKKEFDDLRTSLLNLGNEIESFSTKSVPF